jgi:hypothetical protein
VVISSGFILLKFENEACFDERGATRGKRNKWIRLFHGIPLAAFPPTGFLTARGPARAAI